MKKLGFLILIVVCTLSSKAQTWTWDSSVDFDGWGATGGELTSDNHRNIYYQNAQGDIVKMDASANIIWSKVFDQHCNVVKIVCAPDSSLYVLGLFVGSVLVGGQSYYSIGHQNFIISKFDGAGNILWTKHVESKNWASANDMCLQGNYLVFTGSSTDTLSIDNQSYVPQGTQDFFVGRISDSGICDTIIFPGRPGNQVYDISEGYEVEADALGNIFIIGTVTGKIVIDSAVVEMNGPTYAGFIMKLDQNLVGLWGRIEITHQEIWGQIGRLRHLIVNKQGEPIYSSHHLASFGSCEVWKRNSSGNNRVTLYQFATNKFNRVRIMSMMQDSCGNLYYSGAWQRTTYPNAPNLNVEIVKTALLNGALSSNGAVIWEDENLSTIHSESWVATLLSPNELFVAGIYVDNLVLQNTLSDNLFSFWLNGSSHPGGNFMGRIQNFVAAPVNITPVTSGSVCSPSPVTLSVATTGAVTWYDNFSSVLAVGTGSAYSPPLSVPGTYTYFAEASSCTMTTARTPVTFTILPSPQVQVNSGTACPGGQFTIIPSGALTYQMPGPVVSPVKSSTYIVIGTNAQGCNDTAYSIVKVHAPIQPTILTSINFMCPGQTATLTCNGAQSYTWQTGQVSQPLVVSPPVHTNYSVTSIDSNGCVNAGFITQYVAECLDLDDLSIDLLKVYPNPCKGNLNVESRSEVEILLVDLVGNTVYRGTLKAGSNKISLNVPPGVYFIRSGSRSVNKVLIE